MFGQIEPVLGSNEKAAEDKTEEATEEEPEAIK